MFSSLKYFTNLNMIFCAFQITESPCEYFTLCQLVLFKIVAGKMIYFIAIHQL